MSTRAGWPATEQPLAFAEPPQGTLAGAREPANILLVDDDEGSLRALRHVLEPLGQNLVAARSGEQALRWLLREEFALILLDMRMPGLDGLQTARYINARARTRHIPIIFLTAHAADVERVFGAHAAGAVDYVAKPFEPAVLRSKVAVFVELYHARAEHVREARARAEAEGVASTIAKLQSISDAALRHLQLRELIGELLIRAAAVFGVEEGGLLLVDDEQRSLAVLAAGTVARVEDAEQLARAEEVLGAAVAGTPLTLELEPGTRLPGRDVDSAAGTLIAAPLAARDVLGALYLAAPKASFSHEDGVVLALGAERAAVAIEHARSYERERGLVELLQEHLLPDGLPRVPGLAMAARYRPSERVAQVGGDWYDAIPLPDGRLGVVIGDVVGHGLAAATLMAELRAALRAYAVAEPSSPAYAVAALNALVAGTHRRMVATLLYVVVDVDGGSVRFANAGHPPPLLAEQDGAPRFLRVRPSPPIGVASYTCYEDHEQELAPGSTLLLYTDGLIERRGESIEDGLERLTRILRDAPSGVEDICAHVLARAESGVTLQDDTALIAVQREPVLAEALELSLPAEPHAVPEARHRLHAWLSQREVPRQEAFDIVLAANEACTNAVEHAYGPATGATFQLQARRTPGAVVVRVSDAGRWRGRRRTRGGRGLQVIGRLMDELVVDRGDDGTTVEMSKSMSDGRA